MIQALADTWMHGDFGWGWMVLMMLGMVAFWGAIIVGIVWLIRGSASRRQEDRAESPTEVLDRRFAEGAMSVEDYRQRREVLGNGTAQTNGERTSEPRTAAGSAEGR